FLILYSSNMYGDEIYLCNKAPLFQFIIFVCKKMLSFIYAKYIDPQKNIELVLLTNVSALLG
ncbi:hypothetical protein DIQ56_14550, partial [Acinetobacter baumannii]|nr:hypothetical protein [Acinetobacter baumannii]